MWQTRAALSLAQLALLDRAGSDARILVWDAQEVGTNAELICICPSYTWYLLYLPLSKSSVCLAPSRDSNALCGNEAAEGAQRVQELSARAAMERAHRVDCCDVDFF